MRDEPPTAAPGRAKRDMRRTKTNQSACKERKETCRHTGSGSKSGEKAGGSKEWSPTTQDIAMRGCTYKKHRPVENGQRVRDRGCMMVKLTSLLVLAFASGPLLPSSALASASGVSTVAFASVAVASALGFALAVVVVYGA